MAEPRQNAGSWDRDLAERVRITSLYGLLPTPDTRRRLREAAGLTLTEIAAAVGVDNSTISRYETGTRNVGKRHVEAYVEVLMRLAEEFEAWTATNPAPTTIVGGRA
jgi:predicted transcriptional regulator